MSNIEFKIATLEDVPNIINLCNECFFEQTDIEKAMDIFKQTLNDTNQIYLLGSFNGQAIAHAKITIVPTIFEGMEQYAILNHVCVKEQFRKHSIATHMLEEITKICKERNCISLKLWSNNYRRPAHACYLHFGFIKNDATFFSKDI